MKVIYCIRATYNPGGMERVLLNKVAYLTRELGWDVAIVTTDQQGKPPFYPFPKQVRMTDLGINYADDNGKNAFVKIVGYLRRRRLHEQKLTALLMRERADVVVSLYPSESSFIPRIKDGSKKVLELHFCKFFRLQYARKGLLGLADRWRASQDERIARRFDKFVVLTQEDKGYWKNVPGIEVIPNAALLPKVPQLSDVSAHRVIAVGRLDYQKGFDLLVRAWEIVHKSGKYDDWRLDIFGQGEWRDKLQRMIAERGLSPFVSIEAPTNAIGEEYSRSSVLVMSSRYEGFGMVLVEAMARGVPVVAFDCKCGPKDIIDNGINGLLVKDGEIAGLAEAMMRLMGDEALRKKMASNALRVTTAYSEETVMGKWVNLFSSLMKR